MSPTNPTSHLSETVSRSDVILTSVVNASAWISWVSTSLVVAICIERMHTARGKMSENSEKKLNMTIFRILALPLAHQQALEHRAHCNEERCTIWAPTIVRVSFVFVWQDAILLQLIPLYRTHSQINGNIISVQDCCPAVHVTQNDELSWQNHWLCSRRFVRHLAWLKETMFRARRSQVQWQ